MSVRVDGGGCTGLTVLEIHGDVVAADVGGHGDDGCGVELADQVTSRNAVQIRHDDVHEHEIVLRSGVHLIYSLETVKLGRISSHVHSQRSALHTALSIAQ